MKHVRLRYLPVLDYPVLLLQEVPPGILVNPHLLILVLLQVHRSQKVDLETQVLLHQVVEVRHLVEVLLPRQVSLHQGNHLRVQVHLLEVHL